MSKSMSDDRRIPVVFGVQPQAADAVLVEEGVAAPAVGYVVRYAAAGHALGCLCCVGQSPAGTALGVAFRARATGAAPFFARVVVLGDEAPVRAALAQDVMAKARFRVG